MTRILSLCVESDRILGGRGECVLQLNKRFRHVHHVCSDLTWDQNPTWTVTVPKSTTGYEFAPGFPTNLLVNSEAYLIHCLDIIKRWKPDVIHAHDWDMQMIARNLRRITGIPWVAHFHLFQHEMMAAQNRPANDQTLVPPTYEQIALLEADRVICVSRSMATYAKMHMGIERPIDVVYNGVEAAAQVEWKPERSILFMGRIDPQKGWEHVVEIAERNSSVKVFVAGQIAAIPQEEAEKTDAMKRIRAAELLPNFRYLGHVKRSWRDSAYKNASFVAMPSNQEPFGIVALEAMARGIPLITTRVDGLAEFCDDSNSWLCRHSADSIFGAMWEALNAPEKTRKRIEGGLVTAKIFSWDNSARATLRVLEEASHGNVGTGPSASDGSADSNDQCCGAAPI
jgi:glycogen(starch) synthase